MRQSTLVPYSILDKWFDKVISLNPRVYSTLIGVNNLTARRVEKFEKAGYGIKKIKMLKTKIDLLESSLGQIVQDFEKERELIKF